MNITKLLQNIKASNLIRKLFVVAFSTVAILGTAASCSLAPSSNNKPKINYGILKKDPVLQQEKNLNPEGFVKANAVATVDGEVDNQGLSQVSTLKIHRVSTDTLFILTSERGVFRTDNAGMLWKRLYIFPVGSSNQDKNQRQTEISQQIRKNNRLEITDFTISPDTEKIIYVSAKEDNVSKIFQSLDGGETFREIYSEIVDKVSILFLAVDPINSQNIFAALDEGALIRSTDGGVTWQKIRTFKDVPVQMGFVPEFDKVFFILFEKEGLAISRDNGLNWEITPLTKSESSIGENQPKDGLDLTLKETPTFGRYEKIVPVTAGINFDKKTQRIANPSAAQPWILLADRQMWFSENAGSNFTKLVLPSQAEQYNLYDVTADPVSGLGKIYVSINSKLFVTANRGKTWSTKDMIKVNEGYIGNISQILIDAENSDVIYLTLVDPKATRNNGFIVF